MKPEFAVGLVGVGWMIGSVLVMARSIRRGRHLAETLAARHPALYEELGRPRPGYLHSVRRTRFAQFVGRREYESLDDRSLAAEFEAYRKSEARVVVSVVASGVIVAILALVVRYAG